MERRPLWPARPPPVLHLEPARLQVELVVHHHEPAGIVHAVATDQRQRRPARTRSCRWWGRPAPRGARRCGPRPPGPLVRESARRRPPWRRASTSTTSAPTLWRVPSYCSPGLPRPTTSRSHGVPVRSLPPRPRPIMERTGPGVSPRRRRNRRRRPRRFLALAGLALGALFALTQFGDGGTGELGGDDGLLGVGDGLAALRQHQVLDQDGVVEGHVGDVDLDGVRDAVRAHPDLQHVSGAAR